MKTTANFHLAGYAPERKLTVIMSDGLAEAFDYATIHRDEGATVVVLKCDSFEHAEVITQMIKDSKRIIDLSKSKEERSSWAKWLEGYGAEKFFDVFVANAQGALSRCVYCGAEIYLDIVEGGGTTDWATADELGGDFGCPDSPESTAEGTGGHFPERRRDWYK